MEPLKIPFRRRGRSVGAAPALLAVLVVTLSILPLLSGASPVAAQQAPERPCVDDPLYRQLDFWVGDWQALGSGGEPVGVNRVKQLHGGCVIEENWSSERSDLTGQSMNYVDPRDGRWKQVWMDSSGNLVVYDGELRDGAMHFTGENVLADGTAMATRVVVEPIGDQRLHHRIEHSEDGGETWKVVFDATYVPLEAPMAAAVEDPDPQPMPQVQTKPAPQPAPMPESPSEPTAEPSREPMPMPEPAEPAAPPSRPGEVRATSGAVAEEELPVEERNKVFLESPMILEVPVGPIESIPEAYSWSSDETAVYVSDGVSVNEVTVSRKERRGAVEVTTVLSLRADGFLQHVDLTGELVWQGEVVASASREHVAVGRSVKAQAEGAGLEKSLTFALDGDLFEALFGGQEERPVLRLTVAVDN